MDPAVMSSLTVNPALEEVAGEAQRRVEQALEALATAHPLRAV
jgi:hypothetical protein